MMRTTILYYASYGPAGHLVLRMSTGLAELGSANLTDDGRGLSAVISATLNRMLSNATLTADLMQHDIARRTVVPWPRLCGGR